MTHTKNNCHAWDLIIAGSTGLQCSNCGVEINRISAARALASVAGKESVKKRFSGKTKAEISKMMQKVRIGRK